MLFTCYVHQAHIFINLIYLIFRPTWRTGQQTTKKEVWCTCTFINLIYLIFRPTWRTGQQTTKKKYTNLFKMHDANQYLYFWH